MSKAYWNSDLEMLITEEELEIWKKDDAVKHYPKFRELCRQNNERFGVELEIPDFEKYCELQNTECKTPYKSLTRRLEHLKAMHLIICNMNHEGAYYDHWIYIVPDQPTESDMVDIADDDEEFDEACALFVRIVSRYGKHGFYVYDYSTRAWGVEKEEDEDESEEEDA